MFRFFFFFFLNLDSIYLHICPEYVHNNIISAYMYLDRLIPFERLIDPKGKAYKNYHLNAHTWPAQKC